MSLIVQKYGGTSVGTVERIQVVAERIEKAQAAGHRLVVVVSAMSGETDPPGWNVPRFSTRID